MKIAFAIVLSFVTGFAIGVSVYDVKAETMSCERNKENAERYAKVIAHALNGGTWETKDVTAKCRIRRKETDE